jgi:hypothetical protein
MFIRMCINAKNHEYTHPLMVADGLGHKGLFAQLYRYFITIVLNSYFSSEMVLLDTPLWVAYKNHSPYKWYLLFHRLTASSSRARCLCISEYFSVWFILTAICGKSWFEIPVFFIVYGNSVATEKSLCVYHCSCCPCAAIRQLASGV